MQKGQHHTEEAKAKISATRIEKKSKGGCVKGYKRSEETKGRISQTLRGRPKTEEHKAAMREGWAKHKLGALGPDKLESGRPFIKAAHPEGGTYIWIETGHPSTKGE